MIIEIIIMGFIGLIFGLILAYLSHKFKVRGNPKVAEVREVLPGANCGACGLSGCDAVAEAVVAGKVPVDGCVPGQKAVAEKIAKILGKKVEDNVETKKEEPKVERKIPFVIRERCTGCKLCEKACNFEAIKVVDKKAEVSPSNCKKCMACVKACPVKAIN
jgi:RnfABCDGE-type electron transport complex B subunit